MPTQKSSVRRSLVLSFAQKYTGLALGVPSVIIVSRLLTPAQIGVFSVAAGLVALAQMLRTFGVTEYLVQEKTLTEGMIRTTFTVNLILAWSLAAMLFGASWLIARFYGDPGVGDVCRALSGTFVLTPFGLTAMALLQRNMEFGALYKIHTVENVVRSGLTVGLAYIGFSYMSMAWASLASMAAMVLGCTIWGYRYRAPGLGLSEWRRMLPFGIKQTICDVAVQLGAQAPNVVIGKMLGMADAGFYSRGYGAVNMFRDKVIGAISAVAFPAFAAEHRERNQAPQLFRRDLVYLTGISWPFFAFCALMAFPIIRIMFGDQWGAAVPLMRWLCVAAIVGTLIYHCNILFVAIGRVGSATLIEVQYQLARLGITILAALYSVEAVAASQLLVYGIAVTLYYRKAHKLGAIEIGKCAKALIPSIWVTVAASIAPAIVTLLPQLLAGHMVARVLVACSGAGIGWLMGLVAVKHPLLEELQRLTSRIQTRVGSLLQRSRA